MKILRVFAVLLLPFIAISASAQTPAPAPSVQHFVMSGSAASFGGDGAASIASAGVQITTNISTVYEYISNPNDSSKPRVGSGVVNYTRQASSLIPASLSSKLLVDLSNYNVTFQGGAGLRSDAAAVAGGPRTRSIVGNFGIFGSRPLPGGHTQLGLGYKWIFGRQSEFVKVPVGTLNFTF